MNKKLKIELSVRTLSVIAEALGEARSIEWATGEIGDAEAVKRWERYIEALVEIKREGASAVASISDDPESWKGAYKWLTNAEEKGARLGWSAYKTMNKKEVA